jgi:glycolate oxidase FAD binding subunit
LNHSLDGLTPASIEKPGSLDELSSTMAKVSGSGLAAVPWGGGTRIDVGNIPSNYDVAIDISGFTGQIEHEAGDMTVAANAGVTIGTLNALLESEGQRLPFEVRNPAQATVGGSVASNAHGRRQSSTGGIRDWVIGMQIVLADGTVTKSGGRVVKNVQGYELHRLHTGAFGTLGIVSQVAFKLLPLPPEHQTIVMWFDDVQTARDVGVGFVNGLFAPEAISLISGPLAESTVLAASEQPPADRATWALLVKLGGGVRSIERQVNEVVGAAGAASATGYGVLIDVSAKAAWEHVENAESSAQIVVRMNSRTSDTLDASVEICASTSKLDNNVSTICDLGFGALTVIGSSDTYSDTAAISFVNSVIVVVSKRQSSYVIEKCPLVVKNQLDVFSDVGSSIDLMRRIKAQYDPANTLNPGRFAGKI